MRALFINSLTDAALSATSSSINYPIENVIHRFEKKRWQCLALSSVITITFNSVKSINCIFYSRHTLSSFAFELFDSVDSSLYSGADTTLLDVGVIYFSKIDGVKKIVITCSSSSILRIGEIWAGEYFQMNLFLNDFKRPIDDPSVVKGSVDFQWSRLYNEPGISFELNFPQQSAIERKFLLDTYIAMGSGSPFYVDFFESDRSMQDPKFVVFDGPPTDSKNGIMYNQSIKLKEAR